MTMTALLGRGPAFLFGSLAALLVLPVLSGPASAAPGPQATVAARSVAAPSAQAVDENAAAIARRTGREVELTDQRTETSRIFVRPTGEHRLEQYAYPVRARGANGWVPIDTTLTFRPDGTVRP